MWKVGDMETNFNMSFLDETLETDSSANIVVAVLTSLLGLVILIGNGLIIVSVSMVRKLRQPANYLIVSLALSDFLVGMVVLPLTITYDILGAWVFGAMMCNVHVGFDVICCTTSIMNLCMISIDRYLMITRPMTYPKRRTAKLMVLMIAGAWIVSCLIILPALFGFTENVTDKPDYIPLNDENRLWKNSSILNDSFHSWNRSDNVTTFDLGQEYALENVKITSDSGNASTLTLQALDSNHPHVWLPPEEVKINPPLAIHDFDEKLITRVLRLQLDNSTNWGELYISVFGEKAHGKTCLISQEVWFTIYSTVGAFYLPLTIMLCMYWKIYLEASRFKARHEKRPKSDSASSGKGARYSLISANPIEDLASSSGTSPSVDDSVQVSDIEASTDGRDQAPLIFLDKCEDIELNPIKKSRSDCSGEHLLTVSRPQTHRRSVPTFITRANNFSHSDEVFQREGKLKRIWNCFSSSNISSSENFTTYNNNELKYKSVPKIVLNDKTNFQNNDTRSKFMARSSIFSGSSALQNNTSTNGRKLSSQSQKSNQSSNILHARRSTVFLNNLKRRVSLGSRDRMRNVKATRTLGIIVGTFTFCWVPFFILTFIRPFVCVNPESQDCFQVWLVRLVLWLGYLNSALNPIIYIGFSPDLRETFKFMLCCKCTNVDRRLARIELRSVIEEERRKSNINLNNNNNNSNIL